MRKSRKPPKPDGMNGDHSHIYDYLSRLDGRVDQLFLAFAAQALGLLGIGIGVIALILRG